MQNEKTSKIDVAASKGESGSDFLIFMDPDPTFFNLYPSSYF